MLTDQPVSRSFQNEIPFSVPRPCGLVARRFSGSAQEYRIGRVKPPKNIAQTISAAASFVGTNRTAFQIVDIIRRSGIALDNDGGARIRGDHRLILINLVLSARWDDHDPVVCRSNASMAAEVAMTPRRFQEKLADLEAAGLIFRNYDHRNHRTLKAGISLAPLGARLDELLAAIDARREAFRVLNEAEVDLDEVRQSAPESARGDAESRTQNLTTESLIYSKSVCAAKDVVDRTGHLPGQPATDLKSARLIRACWPELHQCTPSNATAARIAAAVEQLRVTSVQIPAARWAAALDRFGLWTCLAAVAVAALKGDNPSGMLVAMLKKAHPSEGLPMEQTCNPWPTLQKLADALPNSASPEKLPRQNPLETAGKKAAQLIGCRRGAQLDNWLQANTRAADDGRSIVDSISTRRVSSRADVRTWSSKLQRLAEDYLQTAAHDPVQQRTSQSTKNCADRSALGGSRSRSAERSGDRKPSTPPPD